MNKSAKDKMSSPASISEMKWRQLSDDIGGTFTSGKFGLGSARVEGRHAVWTMCLDLAPGGRLQGAFPRIRVRAPYISTDGFLFNVHRKNFWDKIGRTLGTKNLQTGIQLFDSEFILRGNDKYKAVQLFKPSIIREIISQQYDFVFKVRDKGVLSDLPSGIYMIEYQTFGTPKKITDIDNLKMLLHLFTEVLDQLCLIGSAAKEDPKYTLY